MKAGPSWLREGRLFPSTPPLLFPVTPGRHLWLPAKQRDPVVLKDEEVLTLRHLEDPVGSPLELRPSAGMASSLAEWRGQGWIVHESALETRPTGSTPNHPAVLAIPTAGRPESLVRTIRSFADNLHHHGHSLPILIAEDSKDTTHSTRYEECLRGVPLPSGQKCLFFDRASKIREINRLAREGFAPEVLSFLWLTPLDRPYSAQGANYNYLMFLTAGQRLLAVDDDILCQAVRPGNKAAAQRTFLYKRFPGLDEALGFHPLEEPDFGASCLDGLGAGSLDVFRSSGGPTPQNRLLHASFWRRLHNPESRVSMINHGIVGDMGIDNPVQFLNLDTRYLQALAGSDEDVNRLLTCRHGIALLPAPQLSDTALLQSHSYGLDLRTLFPPFIPWFRNLDTLFGRLFFSMNRRDFNLRLPLAMVHAPLGPRSGLEDPRTDPMAPLKLIRVSTLLLVLLDDPIKQCPLFGPDVLLRCAGARLQNLASCALPDFARLIGQKSRELLAFNCRILATPAPPDQLYSWDQARKHLLQQCLQKLESPEILAPYEISTKTGYDFDTLRTFFRCYGKGLELWPDLMQAALEKEKPATA